MSEGAIMLYAAIGLVALLCTGVWLWRVWEHMERVERLLVRIAKATEPKKPGAEDD